MGDVMVEKVAVAIQDDMDRQMAAAGKCCFPVTARAALDACHHAELVEVLKRLRDETKEVLRWNFGDGPSGDRLDDVPAIAAADAVLAKVEATHA